MDAYFEQTVTAPPRASTKFAKIAAWLLMAVLAAAAIAGLSSALSVTGENGLKVHFVPLIVFAASVVLGIFVYRSKDKLDTEYDYILSGDTLEVFGIYAERRRKKLLSVKIGEIASIGSTDDSAYRGEAARPGVKKRSFVLNDDAQTSYICYVNNNVRELATLELNDELRAHIQKIVGGIYGAIGGRT